MYYRYNAKTACLAGRYGGNGVNRKDRHFAIGTVVKHFKGKIYRIEDFAKNTETGEMMVVYRQMYPPFYLFVRPEEMFCSEVDHEKYPDVTQKYRMEKLSLEELHGSRKISYSSYKESK